MLNRVILMGRMVSDPELKQTTSGVSVATFRVAVDRNFADKSTGQRQADFIPCTAWRQTADFISKFFHKGSMIALEGSLQSRSYEDKDGKKRTAYEINVDQAYFASSKKSDESSADAPTPTKMPEFEAVDTNIDGDLPF